MSTETPHARAIRLEVWKLSLVELVKKHRETCNGDCAVGLYHIRQMAEAAGLTFTEDEQRLLFI